MTQADVNHGRQIEPTEPAGRQRWAVPHRTQEGIDPAELWSTLREGRRAIFRIAALFFVVVVALTLASRMEFRARSRMYLGELDAKPAAGSSAEALDLSSSEQSGIASETQILQSDALIARAIRDSGLNVAIAPAGWHAPRYLQWLLAKSDPTLVDMAAPELAAINTSLVDNYRGPRAYRVVFVTETDYELWTASSSLLPWRSESHLLTKGKLDAPTKIAGLDLTLTRGSARGPKAGAAFDVKVMPLDQVVDSASRALTVSFPKPLSTGEPTKVVSLEFTHTSPHLAASFLRELMRGYLEAHQSWKVEDATAAEAFVSSQLGVIREALDKTEKRLADYRSNTRVVVLDNEARAMIEQIGKYEEQRVAARLQVASLSDMKHALNNPKANMEAFLMGEGDDTVLENLASSLSKARQELSALEQKYNPAAPDVRQQRAQVDTQLEMIRNYVTNRLTRAQSNLASLGQVVDQYEKKLKTVPGAEVGLAQLARESEVYSKIYSYLLERQQQTAILKASRVSKNRVIDAPVEPYRADSPQPRIRILVSLFGLFLGCVFVVLRRAFSPYLQSPADVHASAGNVPVLANVPWRAKSDAHEPDALVSALDVLVGDLNSGFAESFRMLRTNLYYAQANAGGQIVLVTSPSPKDGKTTTAFSLAAMLAADEKTVLVIDANMRNPTHHTLLKQPLNPGLGNVLASRCEWFDAVRSPAPGVHTMAAGSLPSADLLSSDQMAAVLTEARGVFDFIVLDAPSFPLVSDAMMLCKHTDCVLSVVRLCSTPRKLAVEHIQRLAPLAANFGVVINGVGTAEAQVVQKPTSQPAPARATGMPARDPFITPTR